MALNDQWYGRRRAGTKIGEELATKEDLRRLKRDLEAREKKKEVKEGTVQVAGKAVRMIKHGLDNLASSLNSPYDKRRPKISQLPPRQVDISISHSPNLEFLKHDSLKGQTLKGRLPKAGQVFTAKQLVKSGVTFGDLKEAREYERRMEGQGFDAVVMKDRGKYIVVIDLRGRESEQEV